MPQSKNNDTNPREEILLMKLQRIYDIELQLVKAIPKMIKNAQSESLKRALDNHLKETGNQVSRLEDLFVRMNQKAKKMKSEAIRGHILDAEVGMKAISEPELKDMAIIGDGRGVEKMEMHEYEMLIKIARELGQNDVAEVAELNLAEEVNAESTLKELGENGRMKEQKG